MIAPLFLALILLFPLAIGWFVAWELGDLLSPTPRAVRIDRRR
jgi:hypothetical protein